MKDEQKIVLEFIIHTLKENNGFIEIYRLKKAIANKGYFSNEIKRMADVLQQIDLAEYDKVEESIKLTEKGWEFISFENQRVKENTTHKLRTLTIENLSYKNSMKEKELEIKKLTIKNKKLQNRQLKRCVQYSVIGFVFGVILTNIKSILLYFKVL